MPVKFIRQLANASSSIRGVARGAPITIGQFLSRPLWCSLGFSYTAPRPRCGLPSPRPLWFVPFSKFLAAPLSSIIPCFVKFQTHAGKTSRRRSVRKRREGTSGWHRRKKRSFDGCREDAERLSLLFILFT